MYVVSVLFPLDSWATHAGCVDSCTSQGQLEKMAALGSLLVFMVTGAAYLVQPGFIYSVPPVLELGLF